MKAVLALGRYGDCTNALPIAYKLWLDTGEQPGFIISKDYVDLLNGVSYVVPYVYEGHFSEVGRAYDHFKNQFDKIHVAQVYGSNWTPRCDSFCEDMWAQTGLEYDQKVPLVFDQRDTVREDKLIKQYVTGIYSKFILVNLSGNSSPFANSEKVTNVLQAGWGLVANIIDLSKIKAHRIYDLLGLYDTADLLITSDTATLHLAQASDIPSIQFIVDTPTPWHGSTTKGNCLLSVRYPDVLSNMLDIQLTIGKLLTW